MRPKVLLIGNSNSIINSLFMHLIDDFEFQTTSSRTEDFISHIKYFKPNLFVYCMSNESDKAIRAVDTLKHRHTDWKLPIIVIGSSDDFRDFEKIVVNAADLYIERTLPLPKIKEKFLELMPVSNDSELIINALKENPNNKKLDTTDDDALLNELLTSMGKEPLTESSNKISLDNENNSDEINIEPAEDVKKHILVVDDDSMMLKLIKEHLHDDYNVATAINGKLALKFLTTKKTDLILLDYEMPGENGSEVFEKLKENEATSDIPLVFLTGVNDKEKIKKVLSMRPQGYLLKPIEREKLLTTIKNIFH